MVEEVIYEDFDLGWGQIMPVTLITYKTGNQDIHRQTGPQFREHLRAAKEVLNNRGLTFDADSIDITVGPTGAYFTVSKLEN